MDSKTGFTLLSPVATGDSQIVLAEEIGSGRIVGKEPVGRNYLLNYRETVFLYFRRKNEVMISPCGGEQEW